MAGTQDDPPTRHYTPKPRAGSIVADDPTKVSGVYAQHKLVAQAWQLKQLLPIDPR